MSQHELIGLAGAYALDALDADERAVFEQHLRDCAECAEEVRGMRAAAAELSQVSAVAPPPELRASVLNEIRSVRPLPPVTDNVLSFRRSRSGRVWQGLAAACALIAIATSAWGFQQHRDNRPTDAISASGLLSATDTAAVSGAVGPGTATILYSRSSGKVALVGHKLPAPPSGKTYQLWMISASGTATSAGVFTPDTGGNVTSVATSQVADAVRMGVSVEPAGGSAEPTPGAIFATMNI